MKGDGDIYPTVSVNDMGHFYGFTDPLKILEAFMNNQAEKMDSPYIVDDIGIEGEPTLPNLEPIEFQIFQYSRIFHYKPTKPIFDDDFKSANYFNTWIFKQKIKGLDFFIWNLDVVYVMVPQNRWVYFNIGILDIFVTVPGLKSTQFYSNDTHCLSLSLLNLLQESKVKFWIPPEFIMDSPYFYI